MNIFCIVILVSMFVHINSMVDEYMSCDRLFGGSGEGAKARSARHLLEAIPCDMKKQSFCANKGAAYPETAIWRFKEENRALMRRLYGEMDSPTLYREMRSTADKSSNNFHSSKHDGRNTKKTTKSKQSRSSPILLPHIARSPDGATPLFSALDYNIRIGSGLATVQGAKDNILGARLATRLGGGRLKIKKKLIKKRKNPKIDDISTNSSIVAEIPDHHVVFNTKTTTVEPSPEDLKLQEESNEESTESQDTIQTTTVSVSTTSTISSVSVKSTTSEAPTIQPTTIAQSTTDGDATETTNIIYPTTTMESETMFTTDTVPMMTDFTTIDGSSTIQGEILETEYPPMRSRVGDQEDGLLVEGLSTSSETSGDVTTQQNEDETGEIDDEEEELDINGICEILQKMLEKAGITKSCEEIFKMMAESDSIKPIQSEEMPKPSPLIDESKEDEIDYIDDSIYSGSSTSACPVRREVVSPYWANNTRQQTLALLNIYPFEQYVHMEMCKHEHHEMLCRPGCKCEQQYRMHRLLAFDPSNECRGIFSDWFELPSFCVCKCYESATANFIPRPRKPRVDLEEENQMTMIDELDKMNSQKESEQKQDTGEKASDGRSFQNIPAILPYEAKQALLKEIRHRDNRNLLKPLKESGSAIEESKDINAYEANLKPEQNDVNQDSEEEENFLKLDSTKFKTKKSSHDQEERQNKGNFLYNIRYGNLPVMEFKLPDGTSGSVDKVPRR